MAFVTALIHALLAMLTVPFRSSSAQKESKFVVSTGETACPTNCISSLRRWWDRHRHHHPSKHTDLSVGPKFGVAVEAEFTPPSTATARGFQVQQCLASGSAGLDSDPRKSANLLNRSARCTYAQSLWLSRLNAVFFEQTSKPRP